MSTAQFYARTVCVYGIVNYIMYGVANVRVYTVLLGTVCTVWLNVGYGILITGTVSCSRCQEVTCHKWPKLYT